MKKRTKKTKRSLYKINYNFKYPLKVAEKFPISVSDVSGNTNFLQKYHDQNVNYFKLTVPRVTVTRERLDTV